MQQVDHDVDIEPAGHHPGQGEEGGPGQDGDEGVVVERHKEEEHREEHRGGGERRAPLEQRGHPRVDRHRGTAGLTHYSVTELKSSWLKCMAIIQFNST